MNIMNKTIILLLLISFNVIAKPTTTGCSHDCFKTITWAGCGVNKKGFVHKLTDSYGKENNIRFEFTDEDDTKGIRDVVTGRVQITSICRLPLVGDVDGAVDESASLVIPVAWDPLVVIVHKDNPVSSISSDELKKVFTGEIDRWHQLENSAGRQSSFDLYVRQGKISGVGHTLRQVLFNASDQGFSTNAISMKTSDEIEKAIMHDLNGIAVTNYSSIKNNRGIKILKLDGVNYSIDSLKRGQYPLFGQILLTFMKASLKDKYFSEFVLFSRSAEALRIIRNTGTLPYLDAAALSYSLKGVFLENILILDDEARYNPEKYQLEIWSTSGYR